MSWRNAIHVGSLAALLAAAMMCAASARAAPVAEYRFERLDSGVVADQTSTWPGRVVGEAKLAAGHSGQALALEGKGSVEIPGSEKLVFARGMSVEAWICPERLVAGRIVDGSTPATSDSSCLDTHPGDAVRFITPAGTIQVEHVLQAGRWTHVLAVYDAEFAELAIYVDGKLAASQPCGQAVNIGGPNAVRIGADTQGGNRFFGLIDEVRLYDAALADEDAAARFAGQEPKSIAAAQQPGSILYRGGPQVDYAALLSRNDVVYLSPALYEHEALPVGNGRLCAVVWNGDGLSLQVNHTANVLHQSASGRVRIRTDPPLAAAPEQFEERLALYGGKVETRCRSPAGQWSATTTVLDGMDVIAVHLEGKLLAPEVCVDVEQWRPAAAAVVAGQAAGFVEDLPSPQAPQFARKMALFARADCPTTITPPRSENGSQIITLKLAPQRDAEGAFRLTLYVANPVLGVPSDPQAAAMALLSDAVSQGWAPLSARTADRWARFWEKSFLYLNSPDGAADYMENLWFLHLYWMGCAGEGELAIKFNGGPFLMHRDSRSWGSSYWYQNTREPYWPLPTANHLELCRGLERLYLSNVAAHRACARELFGKRGLQVQETMAITGDGDKRGNSYTMLYLSTGLECALQLYRQAVYARDDDLLRREILPFMKEAVDFYMDYATLGADGRYHVSPEDARETYWRVQDSMTSISALRAAIPVLLRESEHLGMYADMLPEWRAWLERLAPLPERPDRSAYAPCVVPAQIPASDNATINRLYPPERTTTGYDKRFNSENVELDVIFPFGLAGIGSENFAKAAATYGHRVFGGSYGWDWSPVCAARLGLGEEAGRIEAEHCRHTQHWPQGFWDSPAGAYWAGGLVDCPYFDSAGVNAATTAEMLLQSHHGTIRVWPAVPGRWSGAFRLRAETGFLVTSERSAGQVRYVAVESLFGDRCRLVNPWRAPARVTCEGKAVLESGDAELAFPTERGKAYLVELAGAPVEQMEFAPLAPPANADVKYMAKPRRLRGPLAPTPGLPMLGITRDGLTVPRVAAAQNRARAEEEIGKAVGEKPVLRGVRAQWLDAQGNAATAPWLCDGVYGAGTTAEPRIVASAYLLELPSPAAATVVVWSYDRTGQRCDGPSQAREVAVETSPDGRTWQPAGKQPIRGGDLHGQAIALDPRAQVRFVKVRFLDGNGRETGVACDEIEIYSD